MNDCIDLLKTDLQSSGTTKRNNLRVIELNKRAELLQDLFDKQGTDISVKADLETGFNSLGFISIKGMPIAIYDKEILDTIAEGNPYANIILDETDQITFELGYTNMCM